MTLPLLERTTATRLYFETHDDEAMLAGRILHAALSFREDPDLAYLANYGERLAEAVVMRGLPFARGWLEGLWYVGGNRELTPSAGPKRGPTYHDVVLTYQPLIGASIVTGNR